MNKKYSEELRQRFWEKVKRGKPDECWEWLAYKNRQGYGMFTAERKRKRAHRISWRLVSGPIPDGLFVLHKCDNPSCVNPGHLFVGSHADNMADRDKKHRNVAGEQVVQAKLTLEQVKAIREEYLKPAISYAALAAVFPVSKSQISRIILGQSWSAQYHNIHTDDPCAIVKDGE